MNSFGDAAAGGAGIAGLSAIDVKLVGDAVLAGVRSLIDVSVVTNTAEQFLRALDRGSFSLHHRRPK